MITKGIIGRSHDVIKEGKGANCAVVATAVVMEERASSISRVFKAWRV
jgi:hypothetical protein